MTSATDELRRLLDERGVEWRPIAWNPKKETFYYTSDGVGFCADEYVDGLKIYTDALLTPEQAIDATLGRGTCHAVNVAEYAWDDFECSECGWVTWNFVMEHEGCGTVQQPRYCPNCGARVVVNSCN